MKHIATDFFRLPLLAALLCVTLSGGAFAAASGLGVFTDVRQYQAGQFSDVASGAWYESAVKTVYQKGIMEGSDGKFQPDKPITWAEAATITARLHAAYQGAEIPKTDGVWYQQYLDYDKANGLLPSSCPAAEDAGTAQIAREDLCLLMRSVLSEADLPFINDTSIPDLSAAAADAQNAVRDMYAAGIFTGKDGGRFQPKAAATRAEIATVVTRLLCPAQRVGSDSRVTQTTKDQQGNYQMGGIVVSVGDTSYYLVKESCLKGDKTVDVCSIVARTDDGKLSTAYTAAEDNVLEHLSADDAGKIYFVEASHSKEISGWNEELRRLDPKSKAVETLYTSNGIGAYVLYDGNVYILDEDTRGNYSERWKYHIGKLNGKSLTPLTQDMNFDQSLHTDESMYCFGGKLYYLYGDSTYTLRSGKVLYNLSLWSIDLKTGDRKQVIDGSGNDKLYFSEVAYAGSTVWFLGSNSDDTVYTLKRANLLLPELVEEVSQLPKEAMKLYPSMYANGSDLYYQSSGAQRLWKVSPSGEFTELAELPSIPNVNVEYSSIGTQAVLIHAFDNVWQLTNELTDVYPTGGEKTNYLAFLGKPYLVKGKTSLVPAGDEHISDPPEKNADELTSEVVRWFFTERGDFVAELLLVNGTPAEVKLGAIAFELKTTNGSLYPKLSADALAAGSEQLYTLVVPAETLGKDAEILNLYWSYYVLN